MIITFCGHADYSKEEKHEEWILSFLEKEVGERHAEMYLGGYGEFDAFAYECCKKYKIAHPHISLVFVTPYLNISYQQNHLAYKTQKYDLILYPPLESKPPKFAIFYRNQYMIDCADIIIAYVSRHRGGAYKTYQYAMQKKKFVFNLATMTDA